MKFPRFYLLDLVLLVTAVGVGMVLWREFEFPLREDLVFATFLGLLTTATLGVWARRPPTRPFLTGFAAFAWLYLVLDLRLGFTDHLLERCDIGMGYAFMAGLAARWVTPGGVFDPPPAVGSSPSTTGGTEE